MPYKNHPIADIFPMMGENELRELAADIADNGLRESIFLYEDKVLDGRNRLKACQIAGVEPEFRAYRDSEPLAFVLSKNLHRRHLNESQRSMVASKISTMKKGRQESNVGIPTFSQQAAADSLGVSRDSVIKARQVIEDGVPELAAAVESGEVAVSAAAEVAKLPKSEQKKIVKGGAKAVKESAKKARAGKKNAAASGEPEPVKLSEGDAGTLGTDEQVDEPDTIKEIESIARDIDQLVARLNKIKADPLAYSLHFPTLIPKLKDAREMLWSGRAVHVDPYCKGKGEKNGEPCKVCRGTGKVIKSVNTQGVRAVGPVEDAA